MLICNKSTFKKCIMSVFKELQLRWHHGFLIKWKGWWLARKLVRWKVGKASKQFGTTSRPLPASCFKWQNWAFLVWHWSAILFIHIFFKILTQTVIFHNLVVLVPKPIQTTTTAFSHHKTHYSPEYAQYWNIEIKQMKHRCSTCQWFAETYHQFQHFILDNRYFEYILNCLSTFLLGSFQSLLTALISKFLHLLILYFH